MNSSNISVDVIVPEKEVVKRAFNEGVFEGERREKEKVFDYMKRQVRHDWEELCCTDFSLDEIAVEAKERMIKEGL